MEQIEIVDPDYMRYVEEEADYSDIIMARLRRSAILISTISVVAAWWKIAKLLLLPLIVLAAYLSMWLSNVIGV